MRFANRFFHALRCLFPAGAHRHTSLVTQQVPLLIEADGARPMPSCAGPLWFAPALCRVFIGFIIDHFFAPRVMQIVSVGGAGALRPLRAIAPDAGILSALLLGFSLLGASSMYWLSYKALFRQCCLWAALRRLWCFFRLRPRYSWVGSYSPSFWKL